MKAILVFCLLIIVFNTASAQSGVLDPSFGNHGIVAANIGPSVNYGSAGNQVLIGSDSSLYFVGSINGVTTISKKHANGSPDLMYGQDGVAMVAINVVQSVLQNDGKVVVGGYVLTPNSYYNYSNFALARYTSNGVLDNSFGTGGVLVLGGRDYNYGAALAIQNDGKLVFGGSSAGYFDYIEHLTIFRINPDGSLDNSFNNGGIAVADSKILARAQAITIEQDGRVVLTGYGYDANYNQDGYSIGVAMFSEKGTPDSSFSEDGFQSLKFNETITTTAASIQSNGKILIAGTAMDDFGISRSLITRVKLNGELDSSFALNGTLMTAAVENLVQGLAIQHDDKILLAGGKTNANSDFIITRYTIDGVPDNSFSGVGFKTVGFGSANDYARSIAIRNDGKIFILGYSTDNGQFALAAVGLDSAGGLETAFGQNGLLLDNLKGAYTHYTAVSVLNNGKILTAGYCWNGKDNDFILARYKVNGSLDSTFSINGKTLTDFNSTDDKASSIIVQPDGKILVTGSIGGDIGIIRYTSDGKIDSTFSEDGKIITDLGGDDFVSKIILQPDGKMIISGTAIARYTAAGKLDSTFNNTGILHPPYSEFEATLAADGKIVMVGYDNDIYASRLNADGSLDNSFGANGRQLVYISDGGLRIKGVALQKDGKIIFAGTYRVGQPHQVSSEFAVVRLTPEGLYDPGFNQGQVVHKNINSLSNVTAMVVDNDNKIILGGYSFTGIHDDFTIARFDTTGALDNTFGANGIVTTPVSVVEDAISSLAIFENNLYAVGSAQVPQDDGILAKYSLGPEGGPLANGFITKADGDWNNPNTWIGGVVPDSTAEAIVKHKVIITANAICYSLKIEGTGAALTVNTGNKLFIVHQD